MKVIIIEDEINAYKKLVSLLKKIDTDIQIVSHFKSVEDSVIYFSEPQDIDLIFMDIELEDGSSFQIFENINLKYPVIFTTAYNQYAISAFKFNSIDYLLKPIKKEELLQALYKFKNLDQIAHSKQIELLIKQLNQNAPSYKTRFLIKVANKYKSIPTDEITYIELKDTVLYLNTINSDKYIIEGTLNIIDESLNPNIFFRVNRNIILNINFVTNIENIENQRLIATIKPSNKEIIVSRERVAEFKTIMNK